MIGVAALSLKPDLNHRDVACFVFAVAVHSLLLLWKGGALLMPDNGPGLGDSLVSVNFMADVPNFDSQPAGGSSPRARGLFARVKSILKGESPSGKPADLAMGTKTAEIEAPKSNWSKAETLTNKAFADKKGFQGMTEKDAVDIAVGESKQLVVKPSQGDFQTAQPNLKESQFALAKRDAPFKIANPKSREMLANVNAVPVVVGKNTSGTVKSLDGGPGAGPALQSKAFASKGSASTMSGSFGQGGSKDSGSGSLAMGQGSSQVAGGSSTPGAGNGSGAGFGSGSGYGSGRGSGSGNGTGNGFGNGSGRAWGGSGSGSGTMQPLARRTVDDTPAGTKPRSSGFAITGALANRPIIQKSQPAYEMDARVALRFRVDWSGRVLDGILVEISSGSPSFDEKVIRALKNWIFSKLSGDRTHEIQEGVITFVFKGV